MHLKLAGIILRKRKQLPAVLDNGMVDLALNGSLSLSGHSVGAKTGGSANSHGGLTSILNGLVVVVGSVGGGGSASDSLGCANNLTRLGKVLLHRVAAQGLLARKPLQLPAVLWRWSVESAGDWALGVLGHSVGAKTSGSANSHGGLTSILNGLVVVVGSIGSGGSASDSLGCTDDLTRLGNVVSDWVGRWDAVVVALGRGSRSCQEQSDDDGGNKLAVHHDDVAVRVVVVVRGCCCGSFSVSVVLC